MLEDSRRLTQGLIIYSVLTGDFEKLDFKGDALAGVRANFFNSGGAAQKEITEIELNGKNYKLSYLMVNDEPLSWKMTADNLPFQSVKRTTGGVYSVISYSDSGVVCKRQYFDGGHIWLRTEYYDKKISGKLLARIYTKQISGITCLVYERTDAGTAEILFPSDKKSSGGSKALIYSNVGMLWYDMCYAPSDLPIADDTHEKQKGFVFTRAQFASSSDTDGFTNIKNCPYLTYDDVPKPAEEVSAAPGKSCSAYDVIENILVEAHKTNKDLFGEIITQTAETAENAVDSDTAESYGKALLNNDFDTFAQSESGEFEKAHETHCDMVIANKSGRYAYYGAVDENNCRTGRGRTVSPDGVTYYDGEYSNDARSGFGVAYYKNGSINYVGDWLDGSRTGRGVGYRRSDGTMHAGMWLNNAPEGFGARFDSTGKLIDVCRYEGGVRSGKCVAFDDDGNIVVSVYENGEKLSEFVVDTEAES